MNVDPLIASLPAKSDNERRTIRARAEDWVADGSAEQQEAGRKVLDAFAKLQERESASDPVSKVENAFARMPPSDLEVSLMQVLLDNPGATSTALTEAIGWQDKAWQLHFGKIGWDRQNYLWPAPWSKARNEPFKAGILADFDEETSGFTMKPEVVEGLERIGVKGKQR
ncbi:hypothetical protein WKH79_08450 [Qipengyuania sp. GPGPB31]|uniref:hypothetical protein n=1 Tax=Qipengyuania sp. GPGPB31 TaxID=3023518 RepID=UPI0031343953